MLEQMMSERTMTQGGGSWVACIVVALAFLGAGPFSDAAGFSLVEHSDERTILLVMSGAVVFGLGLVFIRTLIRLIQTMTGLLARTAGRPSFGAVLTLIISGTVCILASLATEFYGVRSVRITSSGTGGVVSVQVPFMLTVLAVLTFLAGVALVAVGVWGSIHPGTPQVTAQVGALGTGRQ